MKTSQAAVGLVLLQLTSPSWAQLAQNLTVGNAKALALANAVTADPPAIDSIHFNPAGLTQLRGRQYQLKVIAGSFEITGELERSADYQKTIDEYGFKDPIDSSKSSTNRVSVMLPISGLTELPVLAAPVGGFSITSPDSRLTFANAIYAPMVVGYTRDDNDPLRYQGKALGFTHLTLFSPSVAWKIDDQWSLGASIGFNYTGVGLNMDFRVPNLVLGAVDKLIDSTQCGSDVNEVFNNIINLCEGQLGPFTDIGGLNVEVDSYWSPSVNAGVLWQVFPWLTWGAAYQSGTKSQLTGDFSIVYDERFYSFFDGLEASPGGALLIRGLGLPHGVPKETGGATLDFAIPSHFSTGISVNATPRLKINIDGKYTKTADWKEFKIEFDRQVDFLNILSLIAPDYVTNQSITFPRGYEDTYSWALGMEYKYTEQLALRAGYEDRPSAIPRDKSDFIAPFGEAYLVGTGLSYKPDSTTEMDLGIGMLSSKNGAKSNESTNVNSTATNNFIYNPYAGYNTKSGVTAYLVEYSYRTSF